jgi:hypothetical protein
MVAPLDRMPWKNGDCSMLEAMAAEERWVVVRPKERELELEAIYPWRARCCLCLPSPRSGAAGRLLT